MRYTPGMNNGEPPNYLALLFVIIIAVTVGNLLSNWITAQYTAYVLQNAATEASKVFQEQMRHLKEVQQDAARQTATAQRQQHEQLRQSRASNPAGQKLARQCADWTQTHQQLKSQYALFEKERRCQQYESYIETGILPPN